MALEEAGLTGASKGRDLTDTGITLDSMTDEAMAGMES